jgi:hypothetical protein
MIFKNEVLKFTENTFKTTSDQTVPYGNTEVLWQTQTNGSNSRIYLSNNKIYIHESIKTFWVHLSLYTSNTNYTEYFTEYPAGVMFNSLGYSIGQNGAVNLSSTILGNRVTTQLKTTINVVNGADVISCFLTYVHIVGCYV